MISQFGTQICRTAENLTAFIDWACEQAGSNSRVELVINGDSVDFLAPEEEWGWKSWLGEADAIAKLDRIREQSRGERGRGPFDALRDMLRNPNCALTLLLGNHDVELSLPRVRQHLCETVLESDGRGLRFQFDGEAYSYGKLLIEHGNRYDPWNQLIQSGLSQERSQLSRGLPVEEVDRDRRWFQPPAGTLLVAHAINHLLPTYPFINLLKPETDAMLPLLLSLQPDLWPLLDDLAFLRQIPARRRGARLAGPAHPANPGAISASNGSSLSQILRALLGTEAELFEGDRPSTGRRRLGVRDAVKSVYESLRERTGVLSNQATYLHSLGRAWLSSSSRRRSQVCAALGLLARDQTWDVEREGDPNYENAARALVESGRFTHVVFGHTHSPKKIRLSSPEQPPCYYINSGAWADVIRLPEELAAGEPSAEAAVAGFVEQIETGQLGLLLRQQSGYAEIKLDVDGNVHSSEIYSFAGREDPRRPPLTFRPIYDQCKIVSCR